MWNDSLRGRAERARWRRRELAEEKEKEAARGTEGETDRDKKVHTSPRRVE